MKEEAMEIRNEEEESGEMKEKRKRKQESVSGPAANFEELLWSVRKPQRICSS